MTILSYILVALPGLVGSFFFGYRLYLCEQQLHGARIAIAYKGKVKMNQPLVDWLQWCNSLDRDSTSTGRVVYKANATTVAILKRLPPSKVKTTTVREGGHVRGALYNMAKRRRAQGS